MLLTRVGLLLIFTVVVIMTVAVLVMLLSLLSEWFYEVKRYWTDSINESKKPSILGYYLDNRYRYFCRYDLILLYIVIFGALLCVLDYGIARGFYWYSGV